MEQFYNVNDVLTDDGYIIYKYEFYYNFRNIVTKLENVQNHMYFDLNMIVYVSKKNNFKVFYK